MSIEESISLIQVLPPELSNKIAAGEVVERPAAVVKELLDNAIDSGANEIKVLVLNAGKNLIQITDNGSGMSKEDVRLCFTRHATSKIKSVDDLSNIQTLGFRGEAMASIASVSQVNLKSCQHGADSGWEIEIWGGEERELKPAATQPGTTVSVRNLFYNVPARRAFLKTDPTELRHIIIAVQQAALANPDISFELMDGTDQIYKLAAIDLRSRIADIFGKVYKASLIEVGESTSLVSVYGFIIDPKLCKKNRGEQFLFVNGRPFLHRHLNYVIHSIYKQWTGKDDYPFYALFYNVDPDKVDVNVHPTKLEVKFEDERGISTFTRSIIKRGLNERFNVPVLDSPSVEKETDFSTFFSKNFDFSDPNTSPRHTPQSDKQGFDFRDSGNRNQKINPNIAEKLYGGEVTGQAKSVENEKKYDRRGGFWQLHNQYIISQTHTGMFIVDQHAAHKRILFEKALTSSDAGLPSTQQLLFPQTVEFSATDFTLLKELMPTLRKIGFNIQLLSGNTAIVSGVPSELNHGDEKPILESIIQQYQSYSNTLNLTSQERLLVAYASRAAVPKGKNLTQQEMEAIIDQLFACENPFFDPLNRPTAVFIPLDDVHKRFR